MEEESSSKKGSSRKSESYYFPPEIWNQILPRSPAKTLLRFRCVCKSWRSTIDDPDFVSLHHQLHKTNHRANRVYLTLQNVEREGCSLTLRDDVTGRKVDRISWRSDLYSYRIIRSCNGLVLVNRTDGPPYFRDELRLWNPCIRKSLPIPAPSPCIAARYLFGFAPDSNDYKIAVIAYDRSQGRKMRLSVYRLSNQQWSIRDDHFDIRPFHRCVSDAVFCQGVAYWLGYNGDQRSEVTHLGSFDFDKENIKFWRLPFTKEEGNYAELFFLQGVLAVFYRSSSVNCSIWVLEEDKENEPWTLYLSGGTNVYTVSDFCSSEQHQKEFYCESLVLSRGYGACDLRVFP